MHIKAFISYQSHSIVSANAEVTAPFLRKLISLMASIHSDISFTQYILSLKELANACANHYVSTKKY